MGEKKDWYWGEGGQHFLNPDIKVMQAQIQRSQNRQIQCSVVTKTETEAVVSSSLAVNF